MDLSNGLISGVQTAARLTPRQMMIIAERRLTGSSPIRPELGPEYATAILWAEAALGKALPPHREEIERFLNRARLEHNNNWISPAGETFNSTELFYLQSAGQHGNYPNEEFFVRRIETSPEISTGFQLRLEEEEVFKRETQNSPPNKFNVENKFYSLCRGERPAQSCSPAAPQCSLSTNSQPYFLLAPLRYLPAASTHSD